MESALLSVNARSLPDEKFAIFPTAFELPTRVALPAIPPALVRVPALMMLVVASVRLAPGDVVVTSTVVVSTDLPSTALPTNWTPLLPLLVRVTDVPWTFAVLASVSPPVVDLSSSFVTPEAAIVPVTLIPAVETT